MTSEESRQTWFRGLDVVVRVRSGPGTNPPDLRLLVADWTAYARLFLTNPES